jgi:hypothetical protein
MKVIHLLRKPLSEGTVASNTLKHGVGGLNIDACRVSTGDTLNGGRYAEHGVGEEDGSAYGHGINKRRPGEYQQPSGRWPGNLILQHLDGCECEGTREVASDGHFPSQRTPNTIYGGGRGASLKQVGGERYIGKEAVANWICVEGCPVRALDEQSGTGESPKSSRLKTSGTDFGQINDDGWKPSGCTIYGYGDTGGPSRFFKQVGGKTE